ncbi:MAG: hypothetical protein WCQ32_02205 [bacterium]
MLKIILVVVISLFSFSGFSQQSKKVEKIFTVEEILHANPPHPIGVKVVIDSTRVVKISGWMMNSVVFIDSTGTHIENLEKYLKKK